MATRPIAHVVGARPNFVKAAPVLDACRARGLPQRLLHTGQHYDTSMSDVFFGDLGLPEPDVNLGVGSGSHASQTAALLTGLEAELVGSRPAIVVVYGDVNSTLAASLVAAKLVIPIAHVEAGLRSFDMTMPEEVNRRVADTLADVCFATSADAVANLAREGKDPARVHLVGNTMIDSLLAHVDGLDVDGFRRRFDLPHRYAVATLHRPGNVDDEQHARDLVAALGTLCEQVPVVLPLHPRGRGVFEAAGLAGIPRLQVVEPLGYSEFLSGVRGAALVVTDSGGVQEETTVLGVPCLTVRPNTERPVTVSHGTNRLVTVEELAATASTILSDGIVVPREPPPLWDGHAGARVAEILARFDGRLVG